MSFSIDNAVDADIAERARQAFLSMEFEAFTSPQEVYKANIDEWVSSDEEYSCKYSRSAALEASALWKECIASIDAVLARRLKIRTRSSEPARFTIRCRAYKLRSGDYFRPHRDAEISVIWYLSKNWKWDYGGILYVKTTNDVGMIMPKFNRLVVIDQNVMHFVSVISPHAREPRIAITGFIQAVAGETGEKAPPAKGR